MTSAGTQSRENRVRPRGKFKLSTVRCDRERVYVADMPLGSGITCREVGSMSPGHDIEEDSDSH
jgi:hypothetical protein